MNRLYIHGMEMPKRFWDCLLNTYGYCMAAEHSYIIPSDAPIPEWCPLVPAADVRPVVKAHWIPTGETEEIYGDVYRCSACGCCDIGEVDFCPNCGAKMEESRCMTNW